MSIITDSKVNISTFFFPSPDKKSDSNNNNCSQNPLETFFRFRTLNLYKGEKYPSLANRVYSFKQHFQMIAIEIAQLLLKGTLIKQTIKSLWGLIHKNASAPFYTTLPIAFCIVILQPIVSFRLKRKKDDIERNDKLRFAETICARDNIEEKQQPKIIKAISKDDSSKNFYTFALRGTLFSIEAVMYYSILGPLLFTAVISLAGITVYLQFKIASWINYFSNQVRENENHLSTSTPEDKKENKNRTLFKKALELINTKSLLAKSKQVSYIVNELTKNLFTFGLIIISAVLVFSGQFEMAIIAIQIQAATEAFKCAEQYLSLPEKWTQFKTNLGQLVDPWITNEEKPKTKLYLNGLNTEDINISESSAAKCQAALQNNKNKHQLSRIKRTGFYLLAIIGGIGMPMIWEQLLATLTYLPALVSPLWIIFLIPSAYLICFKASSHIKTEDINWKITGYPCIALLFVSTVVTLPVLLPANLFSSTCLALGALSSCALLAFDHYIGKKSFYLAEIIFTFLSQQTISCLRTPAEILNCTLSTHLLNFKSHSQSHIGQEIDECTNKLGVKPSV